MKGLEQKKQLTLLKICVIGAGSTKHAAERSEGVAKAWRLIKEQVDPRAQLPRKAQEPHKMPGV